MSLTPKAWNDIRTIVQNLLLENSELDKNAELKEKYVKKNFTHFGCDLFLYLLFIAEC